MGDSLENILALLVAKKKISELAPLVDPKGKRYDLSKCCAYHSRSLGHDIQNCWSLKYKIQNLIESWDIVVKQPDQPNIIINLLPKHNGADVI